MAGPCTPASETPYLNGVGIVPRVGEHLVVFNSEGVAYVFA
jgi:hypothetical protein